MKYETVSQPQGELERTLSVALLGVASGSHPQLPTYGNAVHWTAEIDNDTMLLVIHWPVSNQGVNTINMALSATVCRPVTIVVHDKNENVSSTNLAHPFVSWPCGEPFEAALSSLADAILIPAAYEGRIGIDYVDYAAALKSNGKLSLFRVAHDDLQIALDTLLGQCAIALASTSERDTICVHVSMPIEQYDLNWIDTIAATIERSVPEQATIYFALTTHKEAFFGICLFMVTNQTDLGCHHSFPI